MALFRPAGSKVWWYDFWFDREHYRASTKTRSKKLAAEVVKARRRELEFSFNGLKKREKPKTFSVALNEFLAAKEDNVASSTLEILERCGTRLRPLFGKRLLVDITAADIKEYKRTRLNPSISRRYVNMDLELIRAVLRRNGQWERIRPDFSFYRLNEEFGFELPEDDETKLLDECAKSISRGLHVAVTLALCTGMRRGEIKYLRWNQIFLEGEAYLIVGVSKTHTGRNRRVPLNAWAVNVLREWAVQFPNHQPDHYVFPAEKYAKGPDGNLVAVYGYDPIRPMGSWRVAWKACGRRAGIQMRFHDLRHTAVSRMLRAGIPLTTVASIVGWSPSTMYLMAKRYAHILQPEMRKAVAVLEARGTENAAAHAEIAPKRLVIPGRLRPRYDREELYKKVWRVPIWTLAKEYGISDVALAKTCRKLNIPLPGRGYWEKRAAKLPVPPRPPLSPLSEPVAHEPE